MAIPDEQMEHLIKEYHVYIEKIIHHTYYRANPETRDELRQAGMIGLWKGIKAYYKREPEQFDSRRFVDTICAYIRYEMADLFGNMNIIKISRRQRRNYVEAKEVIASNTSEKNLKCLLEEAGLRYDWYLKAKDALSVTSLDAAVDGESETGQYHFIQCRDCGLKRFEDQAYADYIIQSAFAGVKQDRDKMLIQKWLGCVYEGIELNQKQLAGIYNLSAGMTGVILSRFIDICRFVRDCDKAYQSNPNGCIEFPERKGNNVTGKNIPGVKWSLQNRKWKVEISVRKHKSVFIGYFDNFKDAARARRDAEIKYRGKSGILI